MDMLHRLNPFSSTTGRAAGKQQSRASEDHNPIARPSTSLSGQDQWGRGASEDSAARHTTRSRTPSKLRSVLSHHTFYPSPLPIPASPSTATLGIDASSPTPSGPRFRSLSKRQGQTQKLKPSISAPFLSLTRTERPATPSPRKLSRSRRTPTKDQIGTPQAPGAYAFKTWHSNVHLRTPGRPESPSVSLDLSLDLEVQEDLMQIQDGGESDGAGSVRRSGSGTGRWRNGKLARRLGLSTPERAALMADQPQSVPPVPTVPTTWQHPHPPPLPIKDLAELQNEAIPLPLAYVEDVPNGTPGGHRRDLAKGILRDDVRSSSNQIRFFSRDMYTSRMASLSPSPSPTPSPTASPTPPPRYEVAQRRLSAGKSPLRVAQRVSVDACGTPTKLSLPPSPERVSDSIQDDGDPAHLEHQQEEELDEEDEEEPFQGHSLHTIDESPPSFTRTHQSAPPSTNLSSSLLNIESQRSAELQLALQASEEVVRELQLRLEDVDEIKRLAGEVSKENDEMRVGSAEIERLREELDARGKTQAVLESDLAALERHNGDLRIAVLDADTSLADREDELAALRSDLKAAEAIIAFQDAHFELNLQRLEGGDEPRDARIEAIVSKLQLVATLREDIGPLQLAARESEIEIKRLEADVAQAETFATRFEALLDTLESHTVPHADTEPRALKIIAELKAGSAAQERVIDLERDVAVLGDKLGTTRFAHDALQVRCQALEAQVQVGREELGGSVLEAMQMSRELEEARLAVRASGEKVAKAKAAQDALELEVEELRIQVEQAHTASASLDQELKEAQEVAAVQAELEIEVIALKQVLDTTQGQLHDARNEVLDLSSSLRKLELARVDDAARFMKALEQRSVELQGKTRELEERTEELVEKTYELGEKTGELDETTLELNEAREEIARLLLDLDEAVGEQEPSTTVNYEHEARVASLNSQVLSLSNNATQLLSDYTSVREELAQAKNDLQAKSTQVNELVAEIDELRVAVADAEEAVVQAHEDADRQQATSRRRIVRLEYDIEDLKMEKTTQAEALIAAVKQASIERMQLAEVNTRSQAYKEQVERSYADESRRREEVTQVRKESASLELRVVGLEKEVEALTEDKEKLDIALDSKQQELQMIKRRYATKPLTASTPRHSLSKTLPTTLGTPRHNYLTADETPMPTRKLTATATPAIRRQPLGSSTKTNTPPSTKFKSKLKSPARRVSLGASVGKPCAPASQRERALMVEESTEDEGGM